MSAKKLTTPMSSTNRSASFATSCVVVGRELDEGLVGCRVSKASSCCLVLASEAVYQFCDADDGLHRADSLAGTPDVAPRLHLAVSIGEIHLGGISLWQI